MERGDMQPGLRRVGIYRVTNQTVITQIVYKSMQDFLSSSLLVF